MKRKVSLLLLSVLSCIVLRAEKLAQYKFGDISAGERDMTVYDKDPDAKAVMLLNLRDVKFRTSGGKIVNITTNHVRIKILKDEGKELANVSVVLYNNSGRHLRETIEDLEAASFNKEGGELVKTKMKSDLVFREKIDDNRDRVKFSIPKAGAGSIIEYEYSVVSDFYWNMDDWYAQQEIPVAYARYTAVIPEMFQFHYELRGYDWLKTVDGDGLVDYTDMSGGRSKTYAMAGNDIPASKSDDYVWCSNDYVAKVSAELLGMQLPGSDYKNFGNTWEKIDDLLLSDNSFGGMMGKASPYAEELKSLGTDTISDIGLRVINTIKLLQSHLKWNKGFALYPKSMQKTVKAGTGNNADLNLILINMLHDVGVKASPVVMRRRDSGLLPLTHPSVEKINTFIVAIYLSDENLVFADASGEKGFVNAFSTKLYPMRARIVNRDNGEKWINMQEVALSTISNTVDAAISADGTMGGECLVRNSGQAAYEFRKNYSDAKDAKEFAANVGKEENVTVSDFSAMGTGEFSNEATEKYKFARKGEVNAERIYINPIVRRLVSSNPFTDAKRFLPVEFPCRQVEVSNYSITIPEGWEVEELPQNVSVSTPDNGISFSSECTSADNEIHISTVFRLNATFFGSGQYQNVRNMFTTLAERGNDMIVLKKKQ